jgi:hypothetical protein
MDAKSAWSTTWRYVFGIGVCLVLGWFAFAKGERVPLLAAADFGFHELGHMLAMFLPRPLMVLAGSGTQVLVPVGLGIYFHRWRRDRMAAGLMAGWAGTSAQDVSVYIADAPYRFLDIVGGRDAHDWWYLLGPGQLDAFAYADEIAALVKGAGFLMLLGGIGLCVWGMLEPRLTERKQAAYEARLETLPVRRPRSVVAEDVVDPFDP